MCVCVRQEDNSDSVFFKQDDGIAADEGHALGLKGQILLEVRRIKGLAKVLPFLLLQYSLTLCKQSSASVCERHLERVCVCVWKSLV